MAALLDYGPQLLRILEPNKAHVGVEELDEAQGIAFLCLKCFKENGGPGGTHRIILWFIGRGVDDIAAPRARWAVRGRSIKELTLSPSIHSIDGCGWRGWVTNGHVQEA